MSDEEHHFDSRANAREPETYPEEARTWLHQISHKAINIKDLLKDVVEVSTSKPGKHGHAKCHFVAIDIFNGKRLEVFVPSSQKCDVPYVYHTDYHLIDICEDGFDGLTLPKDENLRRQLKEGFAHRKDLVVTVMSAMGEEQICALKDIGPRKVVIKVIEAHHYRVAVVSLKKGEGLARPI
ncbi:Eukaryotic translation initiation factor 5A, partial [Cucurbita argyrosperma subsp. argyrosperma]